MNWLPYAPVLQAAAIIGATCGALGCFALLRRQSLLGDTLAHAALPGVCLAYLITDSRSPLVLLVGAMIAGAVGVLLMISVLNSSRIKQDAALGIVLSFFFGIGIVLLSYIQRRPGAGKSGLSAFLFGQATFLTREHVYLSLGFGLIALLGLILLYKEFKLLSFDPDLAATLGYSRRLLEVILSLLIVIGVMISLRAVGVVLTVALLIAPAAAARQWTHRLSMMILVSIGIGVTSTTGGAIITSNIGDLPTGPVIVLIASFVFVGSLLLAPHRGLLWSWRRVRVHRRKVRLENVLTDLYRLGERRGDWRHSVTPLELASVREQPVTYIMNSIRKLSRNGMIEASDHSWRLTEDGRQEAARVVRNHRLWELYLSRKLELAADHVHRDAEDMEHALPPEIVEELEADLRNPEIDPHGVAIPRT